MKRQFGCIVTVTDFFKKKLKKLGVKTLYVGSGTGMEIPRLFCDAINHATDVVAHPWVSVLRDVEDPIGIVGTRDKYVDVVFTKPGTDLITSHISFGTLPTKGVFEKGAPLPDDTENKGFLDIDNLVATFHSFTEPCHAELTFYNRGGEHLFTVGIYPSDTASLQVLHYMGVNIRDALSKLDVATDNNVPVTALTLPVKREDEKCMGVNNVDYLAIYKLASNVDRTNALTINMDGEVQYSQRVRYDYFMPNTPVEYPEEALMVSVSTLIGICRLSIKHYILTTPVEVLKDFLLVAPKKQVPTLEKLVVRLKDAHIRREFVNPGYFTEGQLAVFKQILKPNTHVDGRLEI